MQIELGFPRLHTCSDGAVAARALRVVSCHVVVTVPGVSNLCGVLMLAITPFLYRVDDEGPRADNAAYRAALA